MMIRVENYVAGKKKNILNGKKNYVVYERKL
jgi:hypothetical protein